MKCEEFLPFFLFCFFPFVSNFSILTRQEQNLILTQAKSSGRRKRKREVEEGERERERDREVERERKREGGREVGRKREVERGLIYLSPSLYLPLFIQR